MNYRDEGVECKEDKREMMNHIGRGIESEKNQRRRENVNKGAMGYREGKRAGNREGRRKIGWRRGLEG